MDRSYIANARSRVAVVNPTIKQLPFSDDVRRQLFELAKSDDPLARRCALIRRLDNTTAYNEGHVVQLSGEDWIVALRMWDTALRTVRYLLCKDSDTQIRVQLYESTLLGSDEFHGANCREYYRRIELHKQMRARDPKLAELILHD